MLHERIALDIDKARQDFKVVIKQVLAKLRREIRLRIVQQRSDVVVQCALASTLVVEEKRIPILQHDVPRLEVTIEEVVVICREQELRQAAEVPFERLFIEGNTRQPQEVVLEVVQIPRDRLPVEARTGITHLVIHREARFDLKTRQSRDHFPVNIDNFRTNVGASPILRQKLEERHIAEILFEVRIL